MTQKKNNKIGIGKKTGKVGEKIKMAAIQSSFEKEEGRERIGHR